MALSRIYRLGHEPKPTIAPQSLIRVRFDYGPHGETLSWRSAWSISEWRLRWRRVFIAFVDFDVGALAKTESLIGGEAF